MSCWSNIEGTWSYNDLIGSKFKIKSVRLSNYGKISRDSAFRYSGEEFTLKAVYFRSSTDGKVITLFRMEEVCGKLFLPKDLELIKISPVFNVSTVCGKFSPCSKNIIGVNEEQNSTINNPSSNTGEPENFESTTDQENAAETDPLKPNNKPIVNEEVEIDDPFLHNIDEWEIVFL